MVLSGANQSLIWDFRAVIAIPGAEKQSTM